MPVLRDVQCRNGEKLRCYCDIETEGLVQHSCTTMQFEASDLAA